MPSIAIVTTFYNDRKVVFRLLESLKSQTCFDFVHYIYDDGSSDPCLDLFEPYCRFIETRGARCKYVKGGVNLGVDKAHETVFRLVEEPYFIWVDSDDWVHRNFVRTLIRYTRRFPETDVFHLNSWQYSDDMKRYPHTTAFYYSSKSLCSHDQLPYICLNSDEWFAHEVLVKTDTFLKVNPSRIIFDKREGYPYYDAQVFFELAATDSFFRFIKKPLSNIYNRKNSVTHKSRSEPRAGDCDQANSLKELFSFYFANFPTTKVNQELLLDLLPWRQVSIDIIQSLNDKDIMTARKWCAMYKAFLRKRGLSSHYFLFHTSIHHAFVKAYFGRWVRVLKWLLRR